MKKIVLLFLALAVSAFAQAATPANIGDTIKFSVTVGSGTAPFQYTWFHNNVPMVDDATHIGSKASALTISKAALADAGAYSVAIENSAGRTDAPAVTVAVTQLIVIPGGVTIAVTVTKGP